MSISKHYEIAGLIFLAWMSIACSLTLGSSIISFSQLFHIVTGDSTPVMHDILFQIRLPRTLSAFVVGGLLSLSGLLMQCLLRNPLADPYILGISSGSAVFTLAAMIAGCSGYWLTGSAWLGSFLVISVIWATCRPNRTHSERLLLTGVALASGCSALISFMLVISPEKNLHSMLFWLLGDLSFAHFPFVEGIVLVGASIYTFYLAKELAIFTQGELHASALGVDIVRLKKHLYLLSALLTACAVSLAGCIGFIGLIVPHICRLLGISDFRLLIPSVILLGGTLLTLADTLSRFLFSPQQIPVGIMMALLGIPIFIFLLHKKSSLC